MTWKDKFCSSLLQEHFEDCKCRKSSCLNILNVNLVLTCMHGSYVVKLVNFITYEYTVIK